MTFNDIVDKMRSIFEIATDVKDAQLIKAVQEADKLDVMEAICSSISNIPSELGGLLDSNTVPDNDFDMSIVINGKTYTFVPLYTILCYYAFTRYLQSSDQKSTSTGFKIQQFGNSIVVPDDRLNRRWEAEKGKADIFIEQFKKILDLYNKKDSCCEGKKPYRVMFIS